MIILNNWKSAWLRKLNDNKEDKIRKENSLIWERFNPMKIDSWEDIFINLQDRKVPNIFIAFIPNVRVNIIQKYFIKRFISIIVPIYKKNIPNKTSFQSSVCFMAWFLNFVSFIDNPKIKAHRPALNHKDWASKAGDKAIRSHQILLNQCFSDK